MVRQVEDIKTADLPGCEVKRGRGRPASGSAMSAAERKRLQRARMADSGVATLTVNIPVDLLAGLEKFVQFKDITKDAVIAKLLRSELLRKR